MMTVDIGRLDGAKDLGIAAPITSETVLANIPAKFRDPDGQWVGLTNRAPRNLRLKGARQTG